jgi:hypothetical protein
MDAVRVKSTRTVAAASLNKGDSPATGAVVQILVAGDQLWVRALRYHLPEPARSSWHILPALGSHLPLLKLRPGWIAHIAQSAYFAGRIGNGV